MLKLDVLFDDQHIYIVNKPAGLKAHGAEGQVSLEAIATSQAGQRLVLMHRLDRDTTGIVLLAKNRQSAAQLTKDFEAKRIRKSYLAIVGGVWRKEWNRVESWIGPGDENRMVSFEFAEEAEKAAASADPHFRKALTTFRWLDQAECKIQFDGMDEINKISLIEAMPKTGRKHQIRLHCANRGCPILGDRSYGASNSNFLALHAYRLDFRHPITAKAMRITSPPPQSWSIALSNFKNEIGNLFKSDIRIK